MCLKLLYGMEQILQCYSRNTELHITKYCTDCPSRPHGRKITSAFSPRVHYAPTDPFWRVCFIFANINFDSLHLSDVTLKL